METEIDQIQNQVQQICDEAEFDYSSDRSSKFRDRINLLTKKIDTFILEDQSIKLYFWKGKLYDILQEYSKHAEEAVTKAIKLSPQDADCLVSLGHILWKKRDFQSARQCFENALESDPKNIKANQFLSIVMRQIGEGKDRNDNVSLSVEIAKKALMLDTQNSQSWYLIGNAYISDYFANIKKNTEQLKQALKAYNQSQKLQQKGENPDLYYNRGNVLCYFEDYQQAFDDYKKAIQIDPSLAISKVQEEYNKIKKIIYLIESKCNLSQKIFQKIVKQIPTGFKKQSFTGGLEYKMQALSDLKIGENKGQILASIALKSFTSQKTIPAGFMIVDSNSKIGCLSVYNCSDEIYEQIKDNTDIYIIDPVLKNIELQIDDLNVSYLCVQVQEINKLYVQDQMIIKQFAQSVVINNTFEK